MHLSRCACAAPPVGALRLLCSREGLPRSQTPFLSPEQHPATSWGCRGEQPLGSSSCHSQLGTRVAFEAKLHSRTQKTGVCWALQEHCEEPQCSQHCPGWWDWRPLTPSDHLGCLWHGSLPGCRQWEMRVLAEDSGHIKKKNNAQGCRCGRCGLASLAMVTFCRNVTFIFAFSTRQGHSCSLGEGQTTSFPLKVPKR